MMDMSITIFMCCFVSYLCGYAFATYTMFRTIERLRERIREISDKVYLLRQQVSVLNEWWNR